MVSSKIDTTGDTSEAIQMDDNPCPKCGSKRLFATSNCGDCDYVWRKQRDLPEILELTTKCILAPLFWTKRWFGWNAALIFFLIVVSAIIWIANLVIDKIAIMLK